jgi:hypothetical protein
MASPMTNDEIRMTNQFRNSNTADEAVFFVIWVFVIVSTFELRNSSFDGGFPEMGHEPKKA